MPIYTYRAKDPTKSCSMCKEKFDTVQNIREDSLTHCPKCGNELSKIMHPIGFVQDKSTKKILSDDNLKKHGFKKLVNTGNGFDEVV